MATYFARNVTGNWASNTSWDTTSSGGAGPAGPPIAGDTATFDSGFTGNITIAASASCAVVTCQAGATGTLTWGAGQQLSVTAGVTFVSGFNLSGVGILRLNGSQTLTTGGLTLPGDLTIGTISTITLADALNIAGTLNILAQLIVAGAFDITCDKLVFNDLNSGANSTHQFVAGQTLTVTTQMMLVPWASLTAVRTFRSTTASSDTFLHYNGTAANCRVVGMTFTDVNCAHAIDNWYGGTLTRTTGITNRTSADIGGGSRGTIIGG